MTEDRSAYIMRRMARIEQPLSEGDGQDVTIDEQRLDEILHMLLELPAGHECGKAPDVDPVVNGNAGSGRRRRKDGR